MEIDPQTEELYSIIFNRNFLNDLKIYVDISFKIWYNIIKERSV